MQMKSSTYKNSGSISTGGTLTIECNSYENTGKLEAKKIIISCEDITGPRDKKLGNLKCKTLVLNGTEYDYENLPEEESSCLIL